MPISTQISRVICDGALPSRLWSSEFLHQVTAILHRHLVEVEKRLEVQTLFISKCKLNIMIFSAGLCRSVSKCSFHNSVFSVRDNLDQMFVPFPGITHCHQLGVTSTILRRFHVLHLFPAPCPQRFSHFVQNLGVIEKVLCHEKVCQLEAPHAGFQQAQFFPWICCTTSL